MALDIITFDNQRGSAFFKAVGHPLCAPQAEALLAKLAAAKRAVAYDPQNTLAAFVALYPRARAHIKAVYAQDVSRFDSPTLGLPTLPITQLAKDDKADLLFAPVYDAARVLHLLRRALPAGCQTLALDEMRLPDRFLADKRNYLNPINFATNFLFFRDQENAHTRLVTANYWSAYGAKAPFVWARVFDENGKALADFEKPLGDANAVFCLDSAEVRREHNLPPFCGQAFLHVAGAAGHDIVKYVVDTYGDDGDVLSCTHDANSFPADLYAGLPAPAKGEKIIFWAQNSHPTEIPANAVAINVMGEKTEARYPHAIAPFATHAIDVGEMLPNVAWPRQLEAQAGRHFVRPRYEAISANGRRRINHVNVERVDLSPDANLPHLAKWVGKGHILPAPLLPRAQYVSECLPTPMSTAQQNLPLLAVAYNAQGQEAGREFLGCLPRNHAKVLNLGELAAGLADDEHGHIELLYDFSAGGEGDGWLHSLFRYTDKASGHAAETSFGSHMFNHLITYKNEPQSYKGPPPGLSTRLFLRIPPPPVRAFCHLIYPVGVEWDAKSSTVLELKNAKGELLAESPLAIPAGGSHVFYCDEVFSSQELSRAAGGYVVIRDANCRLFGYHGARRNGAFALDHMFGF